MAFSVVDLAGAVAAEQHHHLARVTSKRHARQDVRAPVVGIEAFAPVSISAPRR